jgi:tetratricopeptide (TPR) repeat protein
MIEMEIFDQLMQSARQYTEQGKIKDALELYREAIKINDNEKLAKRIDKMEVKDFLSRRELLNNIKLVKFLVRNVYSI